MGYFFRRYMGKDYDGMSKEELIRIAEDALQMQLSLAKDVMEIAELYPVPPEHKVWDQRIVRARETLRLHG
ncbi:MAG: hypothetical protein ACRDLS_01995 [Solirubrobacteraceae bacterium]